MDIYLCIPIFLLLEVPQLQWHRWIWRGCREPGFVKMIFFFNPQMFMQVKITKCDLCMTLCWESWSHDIHWKGLVVTSNHLVKDRLLIVYPDQNLSPHCLKKRSQTIMVDIDSWNSNEICRRLRKRFEFG